MIRRVIRALALSALTLLAVLPPAMAAQPSPAPVTAAGGEPALTLGGLLQIQGEFGDAGDNRFASKNDRLYLRRARLNASGHFLEELDFRLEVDLAGTLANTTGLRAQLTDGFVNWSRRPAANVRLGQFKAPFGYEQLAPDPNLLTLERSLATDRLTPARQLGAQIAGSVLDRRLTYSFEAFNGNGVNNNFNDDSRFLFVGRVAGVPWQGRLGRQEAKACGGVAVFASDDTSVNLPDLGFDSTPASADKDSQFAGKRQGWEADLQAVVGPFELWAELLRVHFEPVNKLPAPSFVAGGYYLQATWYVIPERLQAVLKTEGFDPSRSAAGDAIRTQTVGANWYLKSQALKLMVDYLRVDAPRRPHQGKLLARVQLVF